MELLYTLTYSIEAIYEKEPPLIVDVIPLTEQVKHVTVYPPTFKDLTLKVALDDKLAVTALPLGRIMVTILVPAKARCPKY